MSNPTVQATQVTKDGSSATSSKQTRLKKKTSHIKEVEAVVHPDGKIMYTDDLGSEQEYVIDSMEDYKWAVGECGLTGKTCFEVSDRLYDMITHAKNPPVLITGVPAVFVYRLGTMEKNQKINALDIEDMNDLKAKKARKEAVLKGAELKKFKDEIEL